MRNIELHLDTEQFLTMAHHVGIHDLEQALGYLSTWAHSRYPTVRIYKDREKTDLIAYYYTEKDEHGYTIGAIWHDDHYGFHS